MLMVEQEEEGREAVWVSGDPLRPDRLGGWSLPRRRMTRRRRRRRTTATGCQVIPSHPDRLGGWSLPNQHMGE